MGGQYCPCETSHRIAVVRHPHFPGIAGNEKPAGGGFELADVLAYGGLAEFKPLCRTSKTQCFGYREKCPELDWVEHAHSRVNADRITKRNGTYRLYVILQYPGASVT
ncbi:hypothetical protein GCM10027402_19110 [Arthrobacter monumenti]